MRTGKIVMLVIGSLLILIGLGLAAGAAVVGTLNARQGDDQYFSAPQEVYEVDSYALTAPEIEVSEGVSSQDNLGTLQVVGESTTPGQELFIGVGPRADVDRYLADVQHSELEEVTFRPFRPYYEERQGTAAPAPPGEQDFWTATASGSGEQTLDWNLAEGNWTAVVMNADGSRPVSAELQIGVRSDLLGPLTWTLLISSIVFLAAGIGLAVAGARGLNRQRGAGGPGGPYDSYASAGVPGPGRPGQPGQVGQPGPGQPGGPPQTYGQMQDRYGREQELPPPGAGTGGTARAIGAAGATAAGMARARSSAAASGAASGGPQTSATAAAGGGAAGMAVGVRDPGLMGPRYPVRLYGELDPDLSRWMWLVKWFLAIPHYIVLFFLWIAFFVSTVIAGLVILFTGRYPRGLFDFNVGVVRWSWRVTFYATRVLGTDRYPPFTLQRTDYPADFSVDYPRELSRWLVLVKWWLLVIPQALIVSAITEATLVVNRFWAAGSGQEFWNGEWTRLGPSEMWQGGWNEDWNDNVFTTVSWQGLSLLSLLVLIAAVILLFTGRYPRQLFDLLMGLNRWTYRVLAYTALMRDEYPPFRLDQGPADRRDEAAGLGRPGPG